MLSSLVLAAVAFAPSAHARWRGPRAFRARGLPPATARQTALNARPTLYEQAMTSRNAIPAGDGTADSMPEAHAEGTRDAEGTYGAPAPGTAPVPMQPPASSLVSEGGVDSLQLHGATAEEEAWRAATLGSDYWQSQQGVKQPGVPAYAQSNSWQEDKEVPACVQSGWPLFSDTGEDAETRVPWWKQGTGYSEKGRKDRRTVYMHDDWVWHRSSDRFVRNMLTIGSSGINQALSKELTFVTLDATAVVLINALFAGYQDFNGIVHPGPLMLPALMLPALPFTILMPALSLLLVFRTNTGYSRWNEARTLWGGLINNCRNVVRQCNTFFPDDAKHDGLKRRMAAETKAFSMALRNFLRGPEDDGKLRAELYELAESGVISQQQVEATMAASNRPMFCLSAMSATLRKADLNPQHAARMDASISVLVDLTGANERIFKSPIPLVYTRLTARFLTIFLVLLPLALWGTLGESWNHWATIPAEFIIAFFLFGIEEVGIQIEEPFSILPLEAFCNSAIAATSEEMLGAVHSGVFERDEH